MHTGGTFHPILTLSILNHRFILLMEAWEQIKVTVANIHFLLFLWRHVLLRDWRADRAPAAVRAILCQFLQLDVQCCGESRRSCSPGVSCQSLAAQQPADRWENPFRGDTSKFNKCSRCKFHVSHPKDCFKKKKLFPWCCLSDSLDSLVNSYHYHPLPASSPEGGQGLLGHLFN